MIYYSMVQIDKKIFKIVTFKTIPIWKKNLMPNMSKLKKEHFLVKLFLDKRQEKSQKMEFISFVFTEIWEKTGGG